ncbi:MAG: hypothetical protein U9P70_02560 [Patescibacteria group bacterium]|nr:hypothetical protein [Patescibacteria group bacterium]
MKFESPEEKLDITEDNIETPTNKYDQEVPESEIENFQKDKPNLENANQKSSDGFQDNDFERMKRIAEQEDQFKKVLEKLIEDMSPELYERADHFGLEKSIVEGVKQSIKKSLLDSVFNASDFGKRLKLKIKATDFVTDKISEEEKNEEEKASLLNLMEEKLSSKEEIFDLLSRKLYQEITLEEKELLKIFSMAEKGGKVGSHNKIGGEIEVSLFNALGFEEYKAAIMHEFTHKALFILTPEEIKKRRIYNDIDRGFMGSALEPKEELNNEKLLKKKEKEKEKIQKMFFEILEGIDESLAHRVERYYAKEKKPFFAGYSKKIYPPFFKKIYDQIDNATEGKSLVEFDHFTVDLYGILTNNWKEDLSEVELKKIIVAVKLKIAEFQREKSLQREQ